MENRKITLTVDGLKKLEDELEYLKTKKRKEVSEKIKVALGFGDLSENSEYDEAKNEQAQVEIRINELENMLKNVTVIDAEDIDRTKVGIGTKVKILDVEFDEADWYTVVGSTEADPTREEEKTISNECPLFMAIKGKGVGETAQIDTPDGPVTYKILAIE
ncbi:transcription elongation factor GreA [Ructibacterium gallinarum]|uniref:Transcription elongation factor GreA n=1 Tax=Ructibacterium gallinarum TaxID=2779355 RepID=A0A9D5LZJ8_9FIRM|nr:transcription elongation factor GreA [Ructibacterium gallinarum]MBE5039495.1 transcription elongation factor GreA [Ructibacterium gallinarum]